MFVPLFATQAGVVGPWASPHGFWSELSVTSACWFFKSETSLCSM